MLSSNAIGAVGGKGRPTLPVCCRRVCKCPIIIGKVAFDVPYSEFSRFEATQNLL